MNVLLSNTMLASIWSLFIITASASLGARDLRRAYQPRPLPSSHVSGGDPADIFAKMNRFLRRQLYQTEPCEQFTHEELNRLAEILWQHRNGELAAIYDNAEDKRKFHFDAFSYKRKLWKKESSLMLENPDKYGPGSEHYSLVRDGKCTELVMWWVHHLDEPTRAELAGKTTLPLLPQGGLTKSFTEDADGLDAEKELIYQVTCSDCHSSGLADSADLSTGNSTSTGLNPGPPRRAKSSPDDVPAGTCPIDETSGLPSVWYQPMSNFGKRKKRCDWDYDPPCALCEGIGGYSWGDQEDQITYTSCTPYALPKDIPADNITTPIWPMAFQVDEVTTLINQNSEDGGRFPGADACATHNFANDTETLYFSQDDIGPTMYTKTTSTEIWTLPTADMFIKVSAFFCLCVTPKENAKGKATPTGPLYHDFAKDAVLIGRERIGLEGLGMSVLADHWNKGPHHFWVDVFTNKFVRGWQPWNGLNVYDPRTWKVGPVDPKKFEVPKLCYQGFLHKNVSCIAGYPNY